MWLAALIGLLGSAGTPASVAEPFAPVAPITLTQAQFQRLQPAATADAVWQTVALPDTWAARGLPQAGSAHHRLHFAVSTAPVDDVWALRIDRLRTDHTLRMSGVLVAYQRGTGSAIDQPGLFTESGKPIPLLVEFPSGLLRSGDDQIDIEWRLITRAGMSDLTIGPARPGPAIGHRPSAIGLRAAFDLDHLVDRTVPQLINAAGAALAGFMLLIWWQRRTEHAFDLFDLFDLFGLLWLLVSLRSSS